MNNHNLIYHNLKASCTVKLLSGIFAFLFSTICYGQTIAIDYISKKENNIVQINYSLSQDLDDNNIEVHYYEELSIFNHDRILIDEFEINTASKTIEFDNPNPDKRLYYQLFIEEDPRSHIHSPIYLQEEKKDEDPCAIKFTVSWSNYEIIHRNHLDILPPIPLALPFDSVHVDFYYFFPDSGCGEISLESWSASQIDHLSTSELMFTITEAGAYCIQVHSASSDRQIKSESNIRITDPWDPAELPDIEILHVSVEDNQQLRIAFNSTEDGMGTPDFQYELYRGDNITAQFERVHRIESPLITPFVFTDAVPSDSTNPWYYYVLVGKEACDISNYASTDTISSIFLEASYSDNISANQINLILDWQHHHPTDFSYILWKQMTGAQPEQIPGTLTTPPHQMAININEDDFGGEVRIWLETDNTQIIRSNTVTIKIDILEPLPNAFRPKSEIPANRVFLPGFLVVPANYRLSIFDRNGLRLFFTEDENEGWDGIIQTTGQPAAEGAYIYEISFDQADKPTRGVVYLVR